MLMLVCEVKQGRYLIEARQVTEVIPQVQLKPFVPRLSGAQLDGAAAETGDRSRLIAGLLTYRREILSVVDLGQLLHRCSSSPRISSRIIVLEPQKMEGAAPKPSPMPPLGAQQIAREPPETAVSEKAQPMPTRHRIALLAEQVIGIESTEVLQRADGGFSAFKNSSIWGAQFFDATGMMQQLQLEPLAQMVQQQFG